MTVTEIAPAAFAYTTNVIEDLTLPTNCTNINEYAFLGVSTITNVTFGGTTAPAVVIGSYAFDGTGLTSIVVPANVTEIGDYAFMGCTNLTEITILGKPKIGKEPFRNAGNGVDTLIVHIDPTLAGDDDYMAELMQNCGHVVVNCDAIVTGLTMTKLSMPSGKKMLLSVSVEKAASWGEVNTDKISVNYSANLGDEPEVIKPDSVTKNGDGSLTVEVTVPEGQSGFFQTTIAE